MVFLLILLIADIEKPKYGNLNDKMRKIIMQWFLDDEASK
jgi:hypothetical protein